MKRSKFKFCNLQLCKLTKNTRFPQKMYWTLKIVVLSKNSVRIIIIYLTKKIIRKDCLIFVWKLWLHSNVKYYFITFNHQHKLQINKMAYIKFDILELISRIIKVYRFFMWKSRFYWISRIHWKKLNYISADDTVNCNFCNFNYKILKGQ